MKAFEIIDVLFDEADISGYENTCDTIKCGTPEAEVNKVAVTMFATPDVIKNAHGWGAQLLIVHEPLYYNHFDKHSDDPIECEKRNLLESTGMTVYRYHDHPHAAVPDMISKGMFDAIGLPGEYERKEDGLIRYHLANAITPRDLTEHMAQKLNIRHLRMVGSVDIPCKVLSGKFGSPGGVARELRSDECEIMLIGEVCEWGDCEYVRDAAQLGHKKAIIVMGHIPSERDGMKYIADLLKKKCPELEIKYFESGEVFSV